MDGFLLRILERGVDNFKMAYYTTLISMMINNSTDWRLASATGRHMISKIGAISRAEAVGCNAGLSRRAQPDSV